MRIFSTLFCKPWRWGFCKIWSLCKTAQHGSLLFNCLYVLPLINHFSVTKTFILSIQKITMKQKKLGLVFGGVGGGASNSRTWSERVVGWRRGLDGLLLGELGWLASANSSRTTSRDKTHLKRVFLTKNPGVLIYKFYLRLFARNFCDCFCISWPKSTIFSLFRW